MAFMNIGAHPDKLIIYTKSRSKLRGIRPEEIDGDGLNNSRANLRAATVSENQHNRRLDFDSTSGLKGAHFDKSRGKWLARIKVNGTSIYLGLYSSAEEAHTAYCAASAKYHGEFGRTG